MKKFLKFVLVTLISLFLIVLIGGYIVLKHIDLNQYKGVIEEQVFASTGRELKIGDIRIKPSFKPSVQIQNVSLANASWSKKPYMVEAGIINIRVALLPLIHGNYVINRFTIANAKVNLEENADGKANWSFEAPNPVQETKEEKTSFNFSLISAAYAEELNDNVAEDTNIAELLSKIVIKEVALENVQINYTDKTAKTQSYDIKLLSLDENDDDNIDFKFNVNDGLYKGQGELGALKLLKGEKGYPVKADVEVMGIGVATNMTLFDIFGNLRFDGQVKAKGFMGKDSSYNESVDLAFKGDLKVIDAVINSFKMAGNVIAGTVNVKLDEKVPNITAKLKSDKIDIASFSQPQKAAWMFSLIKEAQATTLVPADKIPYDVLYSVNADADITVDKIYNKKAVLVENLVMNAKVSKGNAVLKVINGTVAQGSVHADAVLSAENKTLNFDADVIKLNLLELFNTLEIQSDSFKFLDGGLTDLYLNLKGKGNTYASIVESLDGRMALIVDKSQLHLGNIGMIKGNIISQLFNTLKITKGNDDLKLTCAVVRTDIKEGLAKFPSGIVVNADKFTIVADGDINFKDDKLSFGVKPFGGKLTDTNLAKTLSSLVRLTGTIQKPAVGVDKANVVKNVVGATMTGPVYLGAQLVMDADDSPCYTALKDTGYETRFPKSSNLAKSATDDVGKVLDDSVGMVKDTAKGLLNMFSGKSKKTEDAE